MFVCGTLLASGPASPQGTPPAQTAAAQKPPPSPEAIKKAEAVLADARAALGGDKLAAIKTLMASGRTRRVRGNNLVPIEFELFLELPDKYLRADEFPAEETDPTSSGFNGDALVQIPPPAAAQSAPGAMPPGRGPAPDPRRARVTSIKQEFARLWLGLFASSPAAYPLTFAYAAVAEAPQGRAEVLDVTGEGTFKVRFFINGETHLPVMLSWSTPPTSVMVTVPGQPAPKTVAPGAIVVEGPPAPAATATKEEMDKYTKDVLAIRAKAQATPVEHRLYFGDYREVDGVRFPFRLRRAIGTETTEETTFDRFRLNPRIDPRRFEAVK